MDVNVKEVLNWLEEYAKKENSKLCIYEPEKEFNGNVSEESRLLEIKRENKTNIIIRLYEFDQSKICNSNEDEISILGISFLLNEGTTRIKSDRREYILDSNGNVDHFNRIKSMERGDSLKKSLDEQENLKDKIYYLLDKHDDFLRYDEITDRKSK